ncbi:MAG: hypothetical protein ACLSDJ_01095 [Butyricimonas faecihominis]
MRGAEYFHKIQDRLGSPKIRVRGTSTVLGNQEPVGIGWDRVTIR